MRNEDSVLHVRGESVYLDDIPMPEGLLHGAVLASPVAHGRIRSLGIIPAASMPGVAAVLTASDIPGENQIGNVIQDEPLLAEEAVHFVGQPIALVLAVTPVQAREAVRRIALEVDPLPPCFDPREAAERGEIIGPRRVFSLGDVDSAWGRCSLVVEGAAETGAQEHLYLEPQSAAAIPAESGLKILSSTQAPTTVQRIAARVLALPMHAIQVETRRLGGAFGGKEDQATPWAVLAALGALVLRRPVKIVLRRGEDMRWTGKRHPYTADYRIGLDQDGRVLAYEVSFYQNSGAAADLSTSILERTLFHVTNSYEIPHVRASAVCCRTNLPPNTAFRGFGGPQAMFVMESALYKAARTMGKSPTALQGLNLMRKGGVFTYGMRLQTDNLHRCWTEAQSRYDWTGSLARINWFNREHRLYKKGIAMMPVCFGISFTTTFLNQAGALVHVYMDGSVGVSTAAVEMGQGVNTKLRLVAARVFSIDPSRVRIEPTSTVTVANTSPTAASTGPDLNGHATRLACEAIRERLLAFAAGQPAGLDWETLVLKAYRSRISLSAHAHYATPHLEYDRETEKGSPFAYHAVGAALVEATLDVLRGTYRVDAVRIVHDAGESLEPLIDLGQVEGGVVQGLGWMTLEECRTDEEGRNRTDSMTTYKVPDLYNAPLEMPVVFLENAGDSYGILGSKAIGEPPFMYGIGAYFALLNALQAAKPGLAPFFSAPLTPERALLALEGRTELPG